METVDTVVHTATLGELECGCPFDREGAHPVGDWVTCENHRAAARVVLSTVVPRDGALLRA